MDLVSLNDIGITLAGALAVILFYRIGKKGLPRARKRDAGKNGTESRREEGKNSPD